MIKFYQKYDFREELRRALNVEAEDLVEEWLSMPSAWVEQLAPKVFRFGSNTAKVYDFLNRTMEDSKLLDALEEPDWSYNYENGWLRDCLLIQKRLSKTTVFRQSVPYRGNAVTPMFREFKMAHGNRTTPIIKNVIIMALAAYRFEDLLTEQEKETMLLPILFRYGDPITGTDITLSREAEERLEYYYTQGASKVKEVVWWVD